MDKLLLLPGTMSVLRASASWSSIPVGDSKFALRISDGERLYNRDIEYSDSWGWIWWCAYTGVASTPGPALPGKCEVDGVVSGENTGERAEFSEA